MGQSYQPWAGIAVKIRKFHLPVDVGLKLDDTHEDLVLLLASNADFYGTMTPCFNTKNKKG